MTRDKGAVFVEKRTYRRRRMADAARLLPVLGVALLSVPLLWTGAEAGAAPKSTTSAMFYIFGVWAGLAGLAAVISNRLRPEDNDAGDGSSGEGVSSGEARTSGEDGPAGEVRLPGTGE